MRFVGKYSFAVRDSRFVGGGRNSATLSVKFTEYGMPWRFKMSFVSIS
jgi:hypothetical protein